MLGVYGFYFIYALNKQYNVKLSNLKASQFNRIQMSLKHFAVTLPSWEEFALQREILFTCEKQYLTSGDLRKLNATCLQWDICNTRVFSKKLNN